MEQRPPWPAGAKERGHSNARVRQTFFSELSVPIYDARFDGTVDAKHFSSGSPPSERISDPGHSEQLYPALTTVCLPGVQALNEPDRDRG